MLSHCNQGDLGIWQLSCETHFEIPAKSLNALGNAAALAIGRFRPHSRGHQWFHFPTPAVSGLLRFSLMAKICVAASRRAYVAQEDTRTLAILGVQSAVESIQQQESRRPCVSQLHSSMPWGSTHSTLFSVLCVKEGQRT